MSHHELDISGTQSVANQPELTPDNNVSAASSLERTRRLQKLKQEFTGVQDPNAVVEALDYAMQCFQTSRDDHTKHLHLLAVGVLVQIISSASPKHIPANIVETIYASLEKTSLMQKAASATTLAHLRLLYVTLTKSNKIPPKGVMQNIVMRLKECICFGHAPQLSEGRLQPRDRLTVSPSMNTFMLPVAPTTSRARKAIRKRGSKSSLSSARSDTSDSEASVGASQAVDRATIRFEALKCLTNLAQIDPKALHPYWPVFFDTSGPSLFAIVQADPALPVRDMAVQACCRMLTRSKIYLGLAKEATAKSAFTSLSETLASIASRLNQLVAEQLARRDFPSLASGNKEYLLELTDAVLANTPYDQLQQISLLPLIRNLLSLSYSEDTTPASSALPVLSRAIDVSASRVHLRRNTSQVVLNAILGALAEVKSGQATQKSWAVLAALASRLPHEGLLSAACDTIKSSFPSSNPDIRLKQVEILQKASAQPIPEGYPDLITTIETMTLQLQSVPSDIAFQSELARLVCLNSRFLSWDNETLRVKLTWLLGCLVLDANKATRAGAYSCIAAILQEDPVQLHAQFSHNLLNTLIRQTTEDPAQGGKAEAIWCLANVCDSSEISKTHVQSAYWIYEVAVSAASTMGASREAETIRTSAIRIMGTVLASDALDVEKRLVGIKVLVATLIDSSAKIQWNTATSLKGILAVASHGESQSLIINGIVRALLQSGNVKVCGSLIGALEMASELPYHKGIKDILEQVKQRLATLNDLPFEEFARLERTQFALQKLIERVSH